LDGALFDWINGFAGRAHGLDLIMAGLARYSVYLFALYLLLLWLAPGGSLGERRKRRLLVLRAGVAGVVSLGLGATIGHFIARPRPFVARSTAKLLIPHLPDASFPSDHGTLETALTMELRRAGPLVLPVFGLLTLLTMFARVFAGVHYPGDMLGALLVALAGNALVAFAWPWLEPPALRLVGLWESMAQRLGIESTAPASRQK